ncbi:hypothetical protein GC197_02390 [bacterium]|nr:hypothetical protein [bacterium]
MSQPNQPEDLSPFEAQLSELMPRSAQIGRDEILFEAGRQDALREQRGVLYRWYVACTVLACVVCGQWFWLPGGSLTDTTPVASQPTSPIESNDEQKGPSLAHESPNPLPPITPAPPTVESVADVVPTPRKPSVWGQLIPLPAASPATMAFGGDLSIGSAARGTFRETTFLLPKPGRMPMLDQPTLSATDRIQIPE